MTDSRLSSLAMLSIENDCARSLDYDNVITAFANKKVRSRLFKWYCVFITFSCFSVSLLSFRSVCINVLLNSGIGAEFFMTCPFGIGMLYSDISLFTYVQIVVYFLNAAFQFYTSKVIWPVRRGSCAYFGGGGGRSWSATGLRSCRNAVWYGQQSFASRDFYILVFQKLQHAYEISLLWNWFVALISSPIFKIHLTN